MLALLNKMTLFCTRIMKNRSFTRHIILASAFILTVLAASAQELRLTGMASSYSNSEVGLPTASGELYEGARFTACHATLPFGTVVKVTNLRTNQHVLVTINDRFDFKTNRVIDVSHSAAKELGLFENIAPLVSLEVISWPKEESSIEKDPNEG